MCSNVIFYVIHYYYELRSYFSTNPSFKNPLKIPLIKSGNQLLKNPLKNPVLLFNK